jgi:hypothetical protein
MQKEIKLKCRAPVRGENLVSLQEAAPDQGGATGNWHDWTINRIADPPDLLCRPQMGPEMKGGCSFEVFVYRSANGESGSSLATNCTARGGGVEPANDNSQAAIYFDALEHE